MNTEALFLFVILLLGLVLCSFLGGNYETEGYEQNSQANIQQKMGEKKSESGAATDAPIVGDSYNHYSGTMSSLPNGGVYSTPDGNGDAKVVSNSDGTKNLEVTLPDGSKTTFTPTLPERKDSLSSTSTSSIIEKFDNYYGANGTATSWTNSNGDKATIVKLENGQYGLRVQTSKGTYTYGPNNALYNPNNTTQNTQYYGGTGYHTDPYHGAYATGPYGNTAYYAQGPYGNAVAGTTADPYYGPNSYYGSNSATATRVEGPYGGTATRVEGPMGGTATRVEGPMGGTATRVEGPMGGSITTGTDRYGNTAVYAEGPKGNGIVASDSGLPRGVPKNLIPPGEEDLYILKSQVVPPVCPACPACPDIQNLEKLKEAKCPPCKPCGRCPEPSFECKKVPNYNAINNNDLPIPVLNDFSTFGM